MKPLGQPGKAFSRMILKSGDLPYVLFNHPWAGGILLRMNTKRILFDAPVNRQGHFFIEYFIRPSLHN